MTAPGQKADPGRAAPISGITSAPGIADPAALPEPAARVEAVGLLCPLPITHTARAIRDLRTGDVLELLADDRVVLVDLPNWCRSWHHDYLGHAERGPVLHLFVRKRGRAS